MFWLKHIKNWSVMFCFHFVTLGRHSYNIKITYEYAAFFSFSIGFIITRIRYYRPGVGGSRADKVAEKFWMSFLETSVHIGYEIGNCFVYLWCDKNWNRRPKSLLWFLIIRHPACEQKWWFILWLKIYIFL